VLVSKPEPIGLGVIGTGNIAGTCLRAVARPDGPFRVRALCGLEDDRLERMAREFGVPWTTADYPALLARADVDAVAIYSPDHLHFPMIRDALLAGKGEFARCIREGHGAPSLSPALDGAKTVALGKAIKQSVKAGGAPVRPRQEF
jgi:hypothetical protein